MKLPLRQFPELAPGQGLLVGAPAAGGRTFFLSQLAQAGLTQGLKTCYLGQQDGNVWLYELVQIKGHLTFVDLFERSFGIKALGKLLDASLLADFLVIDDLDALVYVTGNPFYKTFTDILKKMLDIISQRKNRLVVGVTTRRNFKALVPGPEDDTIGEKRFIQVTPLVYTPAEAKDGLAQFDNLKTVILVRNMP